MSRIGILLLPLIAAIVVCLSCTRYDHDKPDTAANRKGFSKHFGFEPPANVTKLYYYADETGVDVTYQFGFNSDQATIDKIISQLNLEDQTEPYSESIGREFPWWRRTDFEQLNPFHKKRGNEYFYYLWHEPKTGRAWYLEFSI